MRLALSALAILLTACTRTGPELVPEAQEHDWSALIPLLDSAVAVGAAPGAVLGISWRGERFIYGTGRLGKDDRRRPDGRTVYDLASLTKVIALTPLMMQAVEAGRIDLDGPLSKPLREMAGTWADSVTIRQLLTHVSGLPAHRRLWELAPNGAAALDTVRSTPLDTLPGARTVYSDLGLILLGTVIERVYDVPLDMAFQERMAVPLGMTDTRYLPPTDWRRRIAPTEQDPWRGRMLRAEVHDENAAFLGGVAAHAGLFGSTEDLLRFGEWLVAVTRSEGTVLSGEEWLVDGSVAREFTRRQELVVGSSRALGWDVPGAQLWQGLGIPASAVWHTGFTGTAIWVAPSHQLVIVLLANRVHPTRNNNRHVALRREIASRIWRKIVGCTTVSPCGPTT
ncbi:MAG TPA: serine hydrolase domain-containing protein [Gemmatimonadales bacterium]|nr:serine hydrolase domain-containing protein [Gemmatimonadales bacterium]